MAFDRMLRDGGVILDSTPSLMMANALAYNGFYQDAKRALEPAMRIERDNDTDKSARIDEMYELLLQRPVGESRRQKSRRSFNGFIHRFLRFSRLHSKCKALRLNPPALQTCPVSGRSAKMRSGTVRDVRPSRRAFRQLLLGTCKKSETEVHCGNG